jgi:benzoate-CoA ligase
MCIVELPERLNAAVVFVDRHLQQGRADKAAILCNDETITYRDLYEGVNRFGNALLGLGIRMEERVAIIMPDCPECVYAFFGAIKIGAVAIPMNTLLLPADYEYLLNDSRAQVLVIHSSLLDLIEPIRSKLRYVKHVIIAGDVVEPDLSLKELMDSASVELEPADTSKDDSAFWLYSSGTTGFPKGTIHLQHDMIVEADLYAQRVIGLVESDVSFSVAKLFFAYGLGNGLYFSFGLAEQPCCFPTDPYRKKFTK